MPDLAKPNPFPLNDQESATNWAYLVCHAIEDCGASPELTRAVVLAGELMNRINQHEKTFGRIETPEYPKPSNFSTITPIDGATVDYKEADLNILVERIEGEYLAFDSDTPTYRRMRHGRIVRWIEALISRRARV